MISRNDGYTHTDSPSRTSAWQSGLYRRCTLGPSETSPGSSSIFRCVAPLSNPSPAHTQTHMKCRRLEVNCDGLGTSLAAKAAKLLYMYNFYYKQLNYTIVCHKMAIFLVYKLLRYSRSLVMGISDACYLGFVHVLS